MTSVSTVAHDLSELSVGHYKLIYGYTTPLASHEGHVKIGEATLHTRLTLRELKESCREEEGLYTSGAIHQAALERIKHQAQTIQVPTKLLFSYLALGEKEGRLFSFRDHDVHRVLARSGYPKQTLVGNAASEWFKIDPFLAKEALRATARGESYFAQAQDEIATIVLRPEQQQAVDKALSIFQKGTHAAPKECLWNAIMRFGKTVTAYSLVKQASDMERVLIITHRPVVAAGWQQDFQAVLGSTDYVFASKKKGESYENAKGAQKLVYFASIQDLRGSFEDVKPPEALDGDAEEVTQEAAREVFTKNAEIFDASWDLLIVDEAHEGSQTTLATTMFENIRARYKLSLSGTPFNISQHFTQEQTYSWGYDDEQQAKATWEEQHPQEANPYAHLPEIEIRTYNIEKALDSHARLLKDGASFSFSKFFKTTKEKIAGKYNESYSPFERPDDVEALLDLLCEKKRALTSEGHAVIDREGLFPFSSNTADVDFADTFWLLPTLDSTKALHEMLGRHSYFKRFFVVNASGDNDSGDPLKDVQEAIQKHERTITLSIGKLTTGTTVPAWTAVFMLSNMSSAMLYAQAAFRSKSSGSLRDGRAKEKGYVFDFDPDRTLKVVSEIALEATAPQDDAAPEELALDFLKTEERYRSVLPVIIWDGATFQRADSKLIMKSMKRFSASKVVEAGFANNKLFNDRLDTIDPTIFDRLKRFSKGQKPIKEQESEGKLTISSSTLSIRLQELKDDPTALEKPAKGASLEVVEEYREAREVVSLAQKRREVARGILRAITARLPLMILGMPARDSAALLTPASFPHLVDDASWEEFMPKGLTKFASDDESSIAWEELAPFLDEEVFAEAVAQLEERVVAIHSLPPLQRVLPLYQLFSTFKNPDKETVLTPAKVVNLQYGSTLGGLRWLDDAGLARVREVSTGEISHKELSLVAHSDLYEAAPEWLTAPAGVEEVWRPQATILDINSKTSLYPLYAALSFYERAVHHQEAGGYRVTSALSATLWASALERVYANTRVPYSARFFERVLYGYGDASAAQVTTIDVLELREAMQKLEAKFFELWKRVRNNVRKSEAQATFKEEVEPLLYRWVFNPEAMRKPVEKDGKIVKEAEVRAEKLMEAAKTESGLELLESVLQEAESDGAPAFTAVVGNPPYQLEIAGVGSRPGKMDIFQHFQFIASYISPNTSLLYPATWQQDINTGLGSFLMKNGIVSSTTYDGYYLFNTEVNLPVTVVHTVKDSNSTFITINGRNVEKHNLTIWLDNPESELLFAKSMLFPKRIAPPIEVSPWNNQSQLPFKTFKKVDNEKAEYVSILIKARAGKQADASKVYALKKDIDNALPDYNNMKKYKVVIRYRLLGRQAIFNEVVFKRNGGNGIQAEIFGPNEFFGSTRWELRSFDTLIEAENFTSYVNTKLMALFFALDFSRKTFGSFVPDLEDYTDSNPQIDWEEDIEPQLLSLLGLAYDNSLLVSKNGVLNA